MLYCLIGFRPDYDPTEAVAKKKTYVITGANGVRNHYDVGKADGSSAEFLITETYEKLDEVISAIPAPGWTGVDKFRELLLCLDGEAKSESVDLIARDFPNNADKNDAAAFGLLKRDLITKLAEHTYPGNRMHNYLTKKVKYVRCKTDGRAQEPRKYLARLQRLRKMSAMMHHTQGDQFMTDEAFTRMLWDSYPDDMQEWLTDEQNQDPFDPASPMDHDDITDAMQRYWNRNLKNKKPKEDGGNQQGGKRKKDDDDDDQQSNKKQRSNKNFRNARGGGGRGGGNNGGENDGGGRDDCPIKGHEKHRHDWKGCFLNPENLLGHYDQTAAQDFYDNKAHGANGWYRRKYEEYQHNGRNGGGRGGYYQGGRGGGRNGGRGGRFGGRGGRGGGYHHYQGRGGGRGGYNQQYHQNSQESSGNGGGGYHYQQQGYHYQGGGQQHQQQPPQQ